MQCFVVFEKFARAYLFQIALKIIWLPILISQKYSGFISEKKKTRNKVWIKCVSVKAELLLYKEFQLTEDVKDDFQSVLGSLSTVMFLCLIRWNANRCYSLRTKCLIFETFQTIFPTPSLTFTAVKLKSSYMYRKSYERECITWYMGTSDVLKVLKIARAAGECNLRTWKTLRVTIYHEMHERSYDFLFIIFSKNYK